MADSSSHMSIGRVADSGSVGRERNASNVDLGQSAKGTTQPATVLVLGDSISAAYGIQRQDGWVNLLQGHLRALDEQLTVVNASISGDTTGGGLARFAASLVQHQPAIVILELGGNDGLRGYPLANIRSNLEQLVQQAKDADAKVLILGMQIPPNYGVRYSEGFSSLFVDVADQYGVPLVPSFLENVALAGNMMQDDGIHPTAEAQPLLLETVLNGLEPLLTTAVQLAPH